MQLRQFPQCGNPTTQQLTNCEVVTWVVKGNSCCSRSVRCCCEVLPAGAVLPVGQLLPAHSGVTILQVAGRAMGAWSTAVVQPVQLVLEAIELQVQLGAALGSWLVPAHRNVAVLRKTSKGYNRAVDWGTEPQRLQRLKEYNRHLCHTLREVTAAC